MVSNGSSCTGSCDTLDDAQTGDYLSELLTGVDQLFTHILECISNRMSIAVEWIREDI